jgi:hypothetical protein
MNGSQRGRSENLIKMFIVGAQKAGTTSLKHYLGEHPQVLTHLQKEFAFFYDDAEYSSGVESAYRKYFGEGFRNKVLLAKNAGLYVKESGLKRLQKHNPACQIVLILRNPVERSYSAYLMEKNYGNFSGEFSEIRDIISNASRDDWRYEFFIRMGMYAEYVQTLQKYFPKDQLNIILFEDLIKDPVTVCQRLFRKLNIDPSFQPDTSVKYNVTHKMRSSNYARFVMKLLQNNHPIKKAVRKIIPMGQDYKIGEMLRNVNKSQDKPDSIPSEMREVLTTFYIPHNNALAELTGIDVSAWNKINRK